MQNKVPEVTLGFWVIKILATTLGETGRHRHHDHGPGLPDRERHFPVGLDRLGGHPNRSEEISSLPLLVRHRQPPRPPERPWPISRPVRWVSATRAAR